MMSFDLYGYELRLLPLCLGAALAFFGWILYWLSLNVTGAAAGGTIGFALGGGAAFLFKHPDLFVPFALIAGVAGIVAGIFLIRKIHLAIFFIAGASLGILAGDPLYRALADAGVIPRAVAWELGLKAAAGLLGGVITAATHRYAVSVLTAAVGTVLLMASWRFQNALLSAATIFPIALSFQVIIIHGRFRKLRNNEAKD